MQYVRDSTYRGTRGMCVTVINIRKVYAEGVANGMREVLFVQQRTRDAAAAVRE